MNNTYNKHKNIIRPLIATLGILAIPLLGSIFNKDNNWGPVDFLTMGLLIFTTGSMIEFTNKNIKNAYLKIFIVFGFLILLFVTWIQLAVGIIDIGPIVGS